MKRKRGFVVLASPRFFVFVSQLFENVSVGFINLGVIQRCKVDLGGSFRMMPHTFTDDRKGDVFAPGNAGPRVTGAVESEGLVDVGHGRENF